MTIGLEDVFRLLLAIFIGGLIGAERELRDKTAGLRTLMFICIGSTLFTMLSMRMSTMTNFNGDPARIAAQIVSGIGFLGAGAIVRNRGEIQGLTTASTIWLVAALGMGVGAGEYFFSLSAAILILLSLLVFPSVERYMGSLHQAHTYHLEFIYHPEKMHEMIELFESSGLRFMTRRLLRRNEAVTCIWRARGSANAHQRVIDTLLADPEIIAFENE